MRTEIEAMDEIVFHGRNKTYGAYVLRIGYRRRLVFAFGVALFIFSSVLVYPIVTGYLGKKHISNIETVVGINLLDVSNENTPPPPPPPPAPDMAVEKVRFTAPVVVDDTAAIGMETQDEMIGRTNNEMLVIQDTEVDILTEEPNAIIETPKPAEIFTVVEEQPSFPGGEEARIAFLVQNLKYPEEAKEIGVQGKVFVTFVIETDGSITDVRVLRGIGAGCDEEAVRVVSSMPKWIPGKQRGVSVRVQFNLPIKFILQ